MGLAHNTTRISQVPWDTRLCHHMARMRQQKARLLVRRRQMAHKPFMCLKPAGRRSHAEAEPTMSAMLNECEKSKEVYLQLSPGVCSVL